MAPVAPIGKPKVNLNCFAVSGLSNISTVAVAWLPAGNVVTSAVVFAIPASRPFSPFGNTKEKSKDFYNIGSSPVAALSGASLTVTDALASSPATVVIVAWGLTLGSLKV